MLISEWAAQSRVRVFHFTDDTNIDLIKSLGGLFSWWRLEQMQKTIPRPGGTALSRRQDKSRGLHDYVRLCFVDNHHMQFIATREGRIPNPRYLELDLAVLDLPGTRFSDMNACDGEAQFGEGLEWFQEHINWRLLVDKIGWHNGRGYNFRRRLPYFDPLKAKWQAEALIPSHVPLSFIRAWGS